MENPPQHATENNDEAANETRAVRQDDNPSNETVLADLNDRLKAKLGIVEDGLEIVIHDLGNILGKDHTEAFELRKNREVLQELVKTIGCR